MKLAELQEDRASMQVEAFSKALLCKARAERTGRCEGYGCYVEAALDDPED